MDKQSKHRDTCLYIVTDKLSDCSCEVRLLRQAVLWQVGIVVTQLSVLLLTASLALAADTLHASSDLIALLGLYWVAIRFRNVPLEAKEAARKRYSYFAITLLVVGAIVVMFEAYEHLLNPRDLLSFPILAIAAVGGLGNLKVHSILHQIPDEHHDHAHETVHWHVIFDIAASAAVGVSAVVRIFADYFNSFVEYAPYADPVTAFGIAVYMLVLSAILLHNLRIGKHDH